MTSAQEEAKTNSRKSVIMRDPVIMEGVSSPSSEEGFCAVMPASNASSLAMGQEEDERRKKKKELNRLAAQRSREKRRNLIKQLEKQVSDLESTKCNLTSEISSMKRELSQLDHMLQNHQCVFTHTQ